MGEYQKWHLVLTKEGHKISVSVKRHPEFIVETEKKIKDYPDKADQEKYFKYVLDLAIDGCNFVRFEKGKNFIQFWTAEKKLNFDFPINKENGLEKYYLLALGLLSEVGFVREGFTENPRKTLSMDKENYSYKIEQGADYSNITGYFRKDTELAKKFVLDMFEKVFEKKKGKIKIEIG